MKKNLFTETHFSSVHNAVCEEGDWKASNDDPHFVLNNEAKFRAGWWRIELTMDSETDVLPKVYFDFGDGFNELECGLLKPVNDRNYSAVVKFPVAPVGVRFDPVDKESAFTVETLTMHRLSLAPFTAFALKRSAVLIMEDPKKNLPRVTGAAKSILGKKRFHNVHPAPITAPSADAYRDWRAEWDYDPSLDKAALIKTISELAERPKISILMPVYNTDRALLNKTIESVRAQVYENWELCICDDKSPLNHIKRQLKEWEAKDERIKVVYRDKNGHISKASNSALEIVQSDWVALLDHDDLLSENALAEIAIAINDNPNGEIFYSDEDKIDSSGKRYEPHFKCNFSGELFRSMNYLNHLTVHKTENIRQVGGWRHKFVGSQDYDLNLRIWELLEDQQIVHIPKVLYHWRAIEGSTALAIGEKNYALDAGLNALNEHLIRSGGKAKADVIPGLPFFRVKYDLPSPLPLVSLVIPTKNGVDLVRDCVRSICEKADYPNFEILIIDNNSDEQASLDYFELLERRGVARVLKYPHPFNYSAINNFGVKHARGSIIGLVNNDIEAITHGWLREMVSLASIEGNGCIGAKLYFSNNTIQHAGVILGIGGVAGHAHKYFDREAYGYFSRARVTQNLSAVTAACLLVDKAIFNEVGGLNEEHLAVAFNDVDFCLKVREAGYLNVWTPFAELYHYESISRGTEDNPDKILRFNSEVDYMKARWSEVLANDPYYSPNLSDLHEDFSIRG